MIATPLTKLTQKKIKFSWSDACESGFEKLKDKLTSALIFNLIKGTDRFMVNYDASLVGLGCYSNVAWKSDSLCFQEFKGT